MKRRPDATIYSEAMAELRARHYEEFEDIRRSRLEAAGIVVKHLDVETTKRAILAYCRRYIRQHGKSPSFREIGVAVGWSGEACRRYVDLLVAEGRLRRSVTAPRSIEVVKSSRSKR